METTQVKIRLKDGKETEITVSITKIKDDRHRFSAEEGAAVPALFVFEHQQQHTRLDLSLLEDHLLISFDKDGQQVGVTYCKKHDGGPFEVHNKQRSFLLVRRTEFFNPEILVGISLQG